MNYVLLFYTPYPISPMDNTGYYNGNNGEWYGELYTYNNDPWTKK